MLINCSELSGKHKNDILAHALLAGPHPNIDAVLKTMEHLKGKDRVIDVKVLFNGVEYDGQILEDLLKEQWKHLTDKLEKKYESLDKLANEIATKRFESHVKAQVDPVYEKITKLHTILGEVETSLYDLIPESITNEI